MAKKQLQEEELKLPDVEVTEEQIEQIGELKGKVFMDFLQFKDEDGVNEGEVFNLFIKRSLEPLGITIEDPGEQLSFPTYTKIVVKVMENNNLQELFQAFEKLNRNSPVK